MNKTIKFIDDIKCNITKDHTKIFDSFELVDDNQIDLFVTKLIKERKKHRYLVTRTKENYIREIKAHNRLYNLGLFKSHTQDTDLEENIKKWKERIFYILGM